MFSPRVRNALVGAIGCLALGGCASYYNPYGYGGGYGSRYGYGYPYGGVSVGYGNGYYSPYYGSGYYGSRYGYGYGYPYGWYNGFYYPGTGFYVYDRYNRPHRWTRSQQRYWQNRRSTWQQHNRVVSRQVIVRRDDPRGTRRDGSRDGRRDGRRDRD